METTLPQVGFESYVRFKEPVRSYIESKYLIDPDNTKFRVVSVISMIDMIKNDYRDPYSEVYSPIGITEESYRRDLLDDIKIITLKPIIESKDIYIRVPINYIFDFQDQNLISYIDKSIVINLGYLPTSIDITVFFNDLRDYIRERYGVNPVIKEVSTGKILYFSQSEHETKESIRQSNITVRKSIYARYEEISLKYTEILNRLQQLNISLG